MHDDAVFGACLAEVRRRMPRDPAEGIFGPESALWRVAGLAYLPASGMRAVLLQTAHPAIAAAGVQNSRVRDEFVQRSLRTFATVWRMIYADQDAAFTAAHHVHRLHAHVRGEVPPNVASGRAGTPYRALDPALLQWVLATMIDNCVHGHALFDRPLPELLCPRTWCTKRVGSSTSRSPWLSQFSSGRRGRVREGEAPSR